MEQRHKTVLYVKVAGVTFEGRQALIKRLNTSDPTRLVPEPTNPYDPNAIAVQVSHEGELLHIGYVPRELAARIAPALDGENLMVKIAAITGGYGRMSSIGVTLEVELEF